MCLCMLANEEQNRECVCVFVCMWLACAFLLGWTPEWTRGSAGWGVAVCDNGTGGDFNLLGRVTHEQEEGMT